MKISYLILSGFFFILLLFSITTYINYAESEKVNENTENFYKSSLILRQSNRFQRNILNMVSGLRGFLITNESSFIQSYDSAVVENVEILNELKLVMSDTTQQRRVLVEIESLHQQWVKEFAEPLLEAKRVASLSDSSAASFNKLYRTKLTDGFEMRIQQDLQRKFRSFSNSEYAYREQQGELLANSMKLTRNISFYLTIFSIITGIGIAAFLANHISSGIVNMVRMANEIAKGNYGVYVDVRGNDEVSQLKHSLNHMALVLAENINLLKNKNDELNQFAHIVSHDIKGPLRGIDNVVTWIDEDHNLDLPPKVKEYLSLIKGRVMRAENLLNGILSYSRVGREVQDKEVVNLYELLEEIKDYLPPKNGIILHIQQNLPALYSERLPLLQIFSNLLINAYKYHDKENGYVKVYHQEFETHYRFFVEDNGPGIAKNYHEKIFRIFQTLQDREVSESTGVGLAIVKKILHDRKLDIEVISEAGDGAIFAFTWPKFKI